MGINPRRTKHDMGTMGTIISKLQHLEESMGWAPKKTNTLLYLTLWKEASFTIGVMSGSCLWDLLSAAIRTTAQYQIHEEITNGWQWQYIAMHGIWPGMMTINPKVRKGNQVGQCSGAICESLPNKKNKELTGAQWFTSSLLTIHHLNACQALTWRWSFLFAKTYFSVIFLRCVSNVTQITEG